MCLMLQLGVCQVMPAADRHTVTGQTVSTLPFLMDEDFLYKARQSYTDATTYLDQPS